MLAFSPVSFLLNVLFLSSFAQASNPLTLCSSENSGDLENGFYSPYNSYGFCTGHCSGYAFAIMQGNQCWCSNEAPSSTTNVGACSEGCPGYPSDKCGDPTKGLFGYAQIGNPSGTKAASSSSSTSAASTSSTSSEATTSSASSTPPTSSEPPSTSSSSTASLTTAAATTSASTTSDSSSSSTASSSPTSASSTSTTSSVTSSSSTSSSASSSAASSSASPSSSSSASSFSSTSPSSASKTTSSTSSQSSNTISSTPHSSSTSPTRSSTGASGASAEADTRASSAAPSDTVGAPRAGSKSADNDYWHQGGKVAGTFIGVAIGVILILALVIFLCWRRRRNRQAKAAYRGNPVDGPHSPFADSSSPYTGPRGGHAFAAFAGTYNSHSRLDSVDSEVDFIDDRVEPNAIYSRRGQSDTSLQDYEDYSRKLSIRNPDV